MTYLYLLNDFDILETYGEGTYQVRVYFFSNAGNIWTTKQLKLPPTPEVQPWIPEEDPF